MNLGYADGAGPGEVKFWPVYLCFIIFGIMISFSKPEFKVTTLLLSLFLALIIGLLTVNLLIMSFNAGNAALRKNTARLPGSSGDWHVVYDPFYSPGCSGQVWFGLGCGDAFCFCGHHDSSCHGRDRSDEKRRPGDKECADPFGTGFCAFDRLMMLTASCLRKER
jgi:hypothetical protein